MHYMKIILSYLIDLLANEDLKQQLDLAYIEESALITLVSFTSQAKLYVKLIVLRLLLGW